MGLISSARKKAAAIVGGSSSAGGGGEGKIRPKVNPRPHEGWVGSLLTMLLPTIYVEYGPTPVNAGARQFTNRLCGGAERIKVC